jgi:glycosyltransferase involved in cell wall biosynthesis
MKPLVSIIAISYNHASFIESAVNSILAQSYEDIELIVLDDHSSDDSASLLESLLQHKMQRFIKHQRNVGYTKTFNEGLALATGKYVVDFALDDVMLPDFIKSSVELIEASADDYGLVFSNADYIDRNGQVIANHNQRLFDKKMLKEIPSGDVFQAVLRRYFICTPTMMMRKEMLEKLGGYDEALAYEDFDLWVRAARHWKFAYLNQVTFQKRKLKTSMSSQRHMHHYNEQMNSVFMVCNKAFHLCKTKADYAALHERLNYEYRQCVKHGAEHLLDSYVKLLYQAGGRLSLKSRMYRCYKPKH